jgi:hypothetical protein
MKDYTEDSQVLVVLDQDDYLIEAGDPDCMDKKRALDYVKSGYTMKTMTLKTFKEANYKWVYGKPRS